MSEMVERVARAMLSAMDKELPGQSMPYDDQTPIGQQQRDTLNRVAVACITAMREPTEGMIKAANTAWPSIRDMHANMIDAAINEGK